MNKIEEEDWTAKLIKIKTKMRYNSQIGWKEDNSVYIVLNQPIVIKQNKDNWQSLDVYYDAISPTAWVSRRRGGGPPTYIFNCFSGTKTIVFALQLSEIEIMGE